MYVYRDYFILHPNQVICRVWSLRLFYRLSLWLAYMLYAKIVIVINESWDMDGILSFTFEFAFQGPASRKSRKLFGPVKPFIKLRPAYSVKLVFSYVVKYGAPYRTSNKKVLDGKKKTYKTTYNASKTTYQSSSLRRLIS